jgi:hypothetical protein
MTPHGQRRPWLLTVDGESRVVWGRESGGEGGELEMANQGLCGK